MRLIASLKRELTTAQLVLSTVRWTGPAARDDGTTVPDDLEASIDRHARRPAFQTEAGPVSYAAFDRMANRYAHWALAQGLKAGDRVALFMGNRPDYVALWFGLSKVGVITALINTHLGGESLAHCIRVSEARHVIFGEEQTESLRATLPMLESGYAFWNADGGGERWARDLGRACDGLSEARPDPARRGEIGVGDTCLLIYTSGTTGLPKAAKMSHMRLRHLMRSFIGVCSVTPRDRILITLPLYHGTGGICAVGCALLSGASAIIRPKFSARRFWQDAVDYRATVFVYVGELCRYLLNQPPSELDQAHSIRTAFGNGLRQDVWQAFSERFGIAGIKEGYGSTEGNVALINFDGKVGAVGRIPPWLAHKFENVRIVAFDPETETVKRGDDGRCIEVAHGEVGEMIGRIGDIARTRYDGYGDPAATEKKVLRDVFAPGDAWFRTGDLMRRDAEGYVYFVDRVGDTFRWKGENVATGEVAGVLGRYPGIGLANVYGVEVPGHEGRAGMAAITAAGALDFDGLAVFLDQHLAAYAQPLFLRLQAQPDTTGTMKFQKKRLQAEGFDPDRADDPLWFRHPDLKTYVPLTPDICATIVAGGFRL
jgi:fatty-acyl-CoA synthase